MAKIDTQPIGLVPINMIKVVNRYRGDKGEIELMAKSLEERGQIHPVLVNKGMKLLAGERRILAAQHLGWETIRAEMRTGGDKGDDLDVELDENQMRKNFTWQEVALLEKAIFDMKAKKDPKWSLRKQEELRDTSKSLVHMRIQLAEAITPDRNGEVLLPELLEFETQDEAWKYYKKLEEEAVVSHMRQSVPELVKQAPQWAGDHYIVGNTFEGMAELSSESFDFAEVDPPYAIDLLRRKGRNSNVRHTDDYNEVPESDFPEFMQNLCSSVYRLLKPNSFAVFWYAMQWHSETLNWLSDAGFAVNPMPAMWYKGQSGQTAQPDVAFASTYEPFFLARKGTPKMIRQGRANVFHYAPLAPSRKIHTTEKPIELLVDIVETICFPGSSILVPFLGSGVTLRAAYKAGHTGMGFDLAEGNKRRFLEIVAKEYGGGADKVVEDD